MKRKITLMSSVSTVALAAVATAAHAADLSAGVVEAPSVPDGFTISVEGGALFGVNTVAEDKLGSGLSGGVTDIQDMLGYRGAISVGKQIDDSWDLRVTAAVNQQLTSSSYASAGSAGSGFYASIDNSFNYQTMDFEVGYSPALTDKMDVRLFAGLRGLHYSDSVDKVGYEHAGPNKVGYGADTTAEFLGVGPRIGVEGSTRLGDSMFGLSGMVAGSAIFGVSRTDGDVSFTYFSAGSGGTFTVPTNAVEESGVVYDLEAALGLDLHIDDATTVTLGYRAEALYGVEHPTLYGSGGFDDTRFSHGPTIKLTGNFD